MITIQLDIITLAVSGITLLLAIITCLLSAFFRRPRIESRPERKADELPGFSVVITTHDNARELEENLPAFLRQDYPGAFEVIVVEETSTDETADALKRMKMEFPHLYTTFVPDSSRYMSRRKLALTLGVKAAKHEWVVFTDINCQPAGEQWLQTLAKYADEDSDLICGYTNYADDSTSYQRFERLQQALYQMRKAQRGTAYAYNGNNLAFRKSLFLEHNGFLGNLMYLRGEYDFMVNEYATKWRTATMNEPEGIIIEQAPSKKEWLVCRLHYMETRRHLSRSFGYRLLPNLDTTMLHLNYLLEVAVIAYGIMSQDWIMTEAVAFALLFTFIVRTLIARGTVRAFGEQISALKLPFFELRVMWQNLWLLWKHKRADKYEFIRK